MRRAMLLILLFLCLCIFAQEKPLRWYSIPIPDPIPTELEDIYELDTLLSGCWAITVGDSVLYPTLIGYRVQEDMSNYTDWPSVSECLERSLLFWENNKNKYPEVAYYEDSEVRIFVSVK